MNLMKVPRRSSQLLGSISDEVSERASQIAKRPYASGGVLLLILGILGFIWVFPEIRRYLRIERM